jgi:hypothetical protein
MATTGASDALGQDGHRAASTVIDLDQPER